MKSVLFRTLFFILFSVFVYCAIVGIMVNVVRPHSQIETVVSRYTNVKLSQLRPDNYTAGTLRRFRELEHFGNLDVLFTGSSHAFYSFNPVIFDSLGLRSFNAGTTSQTPMNTYYLLERYYDKTHPKIVVMEVFYWMLSYRGSESFLDLYTNIKPHPTMKKMAMETHDIVVADAILAQNLKRHKVDIDKVNITFPHYQTDGFMAVDKNYDGSPEKVPAMQILPIQIEYIKKIQDFLEARGTKLVLVIAPIPKPTLARITNYPALAAQMHTFTKENSIPFFDYNETTEWNTTQDFFDFHHLNLSGANKFTRMFFDDLNRNGLLINAGHRTLACQ